MGRSSWWPHKVETSRWIGHLVGKIRHKEFPDTLDTHKCADGRTMNTAGIGPQKFTDQEDWDHNRECIVSGLETFKDVVDALCDIKDRQLYRKDYSTFDDFLLDKLGDSGSGIVHNLGI
jgi:hypothetical protein